MIRKSSARGAANTLYLLIAAALLGIGLLVYLLYSGVERPAGTGTRNLVLFCAAGVRYPMEAIVNEYAQRYGVAIEVQYGGSNTLLNQLEVARTGDLYLAADESYVQLAREKKLLDEVIPLAQQTPVLAVPRDNPKHLRTLDDLLRPDVTVALANPEGAAIGQVTRRLLAESGHWSRLEPLVTARGVFKPTVNDVANDVKLGSVDAGIVWDSTAVHYPELSMVHVPELARGASRVEIGVLRSSLDPVAALRFARFVGARDEGLEVFQENGFEVVDGDVWEEVPEITFFAGSVNRRALEPIVAAFEQREGVRVNTVYNGCGILTAQMRATLANRDGTFPDTYMACDVYYLETVRELFQDAVNISDTPIVIVVQRGNPRGIRSLKDLANPEVRLAVGQPDQCTIGVLTRRLLEHEGLYKQLLEHNIVTQTATSAMLVPSVATGAADAALAYETDTLDERERLEVIRIESPLAKAIQPYSIARSSEHKYLGRRLFERIALSREIFESKGFHWRLDEPSGQPFQPAATRGS